MENSNESSEVDGSTGVKTKFAKNDTQRGRRDEDEICSPALPGSTVQSNEELINENATVKPEEKVTKIWSKQNKAERIGGYESKQRTEDWARSTLNPKHVRQNKKLENKISLLDKESESSNETSEDNVLSLEKHETIGNTPMAQNDTQKLHKRYMEMKKGESHGKIVETSQPVTSCKNYTGISSNVKRKRFKKHKRSTNPEEIERSKCVQKKNMDNNNKQSYEYSNKPLDQRSTSTFDLPSISQTNFQAMQTHPSQWISGPTTHRGKTSNPEYDETNNEVLTQEKQEPSRRKYDYATLKISNLPASAKYGDLEMLFPEAISMTMPTREIINLESQEVNVFAYVLFATMQEAKNIKNQVSGRRFRGHDLIIEYRQTY